MKPIAGVIVAAVTPRGKQGHEVDVGALLDLIDFLCAAGVDGIALLGSTGEFLNLSFDERVRLVYLATKRSRVPVLAGVSHSSLNGALELAREACGAGAAGLLLMPPYFFHYGQPDIREFYLQFAAQIGRGIPIFLYNIPFFTNALALNTAVELLSTGLFAGIKDSSGDFAYFNGLRELRDNRPFTLLVGNDVIFTKARSAGADGIVSGVACAMPELLLALDRAIHAGSAAEIERGEGRLQEFLLWLDRLPAPLGVKAATAARGLKVGPPAVPISPETQQILDQFLHWFQSWLPIVKRESARA